MAYHQLTDAGIKKTELGEKAVKLTDGEGLFLLVNPNGSKLWRYQYRVTGSPHQKLMGLGSYLDVSLAGVRERH